MRPNSSAARIDEGVRNAAPAIQPTELCLGALVGCGLSVEFARALFGRGGAEGLLQEFGRFLAACAGEAFGFDLGLAARRDNEFDDFGDQGFSSLRIRRSRRAIRSCCFSMAWKARLRRDIQRASPVRSRARPWRARSSAWSCLAGGPGAGAGRTRRRRVVVMGVLGATRNWSGNGNRSRPV